MNSKLSIDMSVAKEMHKHQIRAARQAKLEALDVEFQRAIETSADTKDIVAKKQALTDATAATEIAIATTPEDLRKQWDSSILGTTPYT